MNISRKLYIVAALLAWAVVMQLPSPAPILSQVNLRIPNVSQNTTTSVKWTAGTLNNGGHSVTVTAGTAAVTTNRTACTAPGFTSCNIVFANSGGTVTVSSASNALTVANASGNIIMAYVETTGAGVINRIVYPQQTSLATLGPAMTTDCLASSTCAAPVTGYSVNIVAGSATLTAGTVTVTGISPAFSAFNTTTLAPSFSCIAMFNATTSGAGQNISCVPVSGTSLTITVGNSASSTDKVRWLAISNSQ